MAPCMEALEVRAAGGQRGRGVFAQRALRSGELLLTERPLLACASSDDGAARHALIASAYASAPAGVRRQVLDTVPWGLDGGHPRVLAATASAARGSAGLAPEEVRDAILAFELTAFQLCPGAPDAPRSHAVFETLSKFNHACVPSAEWRIRQVSAEAGPEAVLYAARGIAEGEEVTISYLGHKGFMSAAARNRWLFDTHAFRCSCELCSTGADRLREIPCPRCHPRLAGRLPREAEYDGCALACAFPHLPSGAWRCQQCGSKWGSVEFLSECGVGEAEENSIGDAVVDYVAAVRADCFHDTPSTRQYEDLRNSVSSKLGCRHWASAYLELSCLDHLTMTLHSLKDAGVLMREPLIPEAVALLTALFSKMKRVIAYFSHSLSDQTVASMLWEYVWNSALTLYLFRRFEDALSLFLVIEPQLSTFSEYVFETIGADVGMACFRNYVCKCRERDPAHTKEVFFHFVYVGVVHTGGLCLAEVEHYRSVASRMFDSKQFILAGLIFSGLLRSLPALGPQPELDAALRAGAARCGGVRRGGAAEGGRRPRTAAAARGLAGAREASGLTGAAAATQRTAWPKARPREGNLLLATCC